MFHYQGKRKSMKKVQLKKSGLEFSDIGLGTNSIGGHNIYPNIDENVSRDIVRQYILDGGSFIDSAYFYGLGRSEELIGEVVNELNKRRDVIIATKGSFVIEGSSTTHNNSPEFLISSVNQALKRLNTDYIDIFYIHFPDDRTPKDIAVEALASLKKQGVIRAIGVSNFTLKQLKEANIDNHVDIVQDRYNLFMQSIDDEYIKYLKENDIGFIPYSPLASGLLTGKYSINTQLSERKRNSILFSNENYANNLEKIEILKEIAGKKGVGTSQIALAWLLAQDFVTAIIPGAKQVEQMLINNKTSDIVLSDSEIELINNTFSI